MQARELKKYLVEDSDRVVELLEHFGFHDVWTGNGEVRCATPEGTNKTTVSVKLTDELYATSYDTELNYRGDIFGLIEAYQDTTFRNVMIKIHKLFNLKYSGKESKKLDLLKDIRKFKHGANTNREVEIKKYDRSILDQFIRKPHASMIKEAISPLVLDKYDIMFDYRKDRIIFPHYDINETDMIVGIQGRTTLNSELAKELNISKYWNYLKGYKKSMGLFGYHIAKNNINNSKMLIIFEGEKSVLKQATIERGNGYSVALGGHEISSFQKAFIVKETEPDVEIVIAFDKDIMESEDFLISQCKMFSKFRKVSYIYDKYGILGEKDSPIDKGYKRWDYLLRHRILVD